MPAVHRPVETRDSFVERFGHGPVRRADALAAGFSRGSLDVCVRRGLLVSPRYGVLQCTTPDRVGTDARGWLDPRPPGSGANHVELVRATLATCKGRVLVASESAALVQGIALPRWTLPEQVTLIGPDGAGYRGTESRRRGSPVPEWQRTVVDGIPVTSVERTAVDVARGLPLPAALIPLDSAARILVGRADRLTGSALRRAALDPDRRAAARDRLRAALDSCRGWPGTVAVREALNHVDPASESPHESRSRAWFLEAGLGPLGPGTPIACGSTTYWADFCVPLRRIIGEADGWSKYGETPQAVRRALDLERERASRLAEDGWRFVRWSTSERRETVVRRMARAIGSAPT